MYCVKKSAIISQRVSYVTMLKYKCMVTGILKCEVAECNITVQPTAVELKVRT